MSVRLFGLDVDSDFAIAGVAEDDGPTAGRPVALRRATRAEVFAGWPRTGLEALTVTRGPDGRRPHAVDRHPTAGMLMRARGWGAFRVSPEADHVACAPRRDLPAWRWQRYLIGQVLPYVSLLRGHEVWHAAAVDVEGRAVALVGPSGSGKSTLAATLVLHGHELLADDVVALRRAGDGVEVEPGPGLLSLRPGAVAEADAVRLGRRVGGDAEGSRVATGRRAAPSPLGAVLVIERRDDRRGVRLDATHDPRILLGATFNFVETSPDRLLRMLDISAAISRTVPVRRLVLGKGVRPGEAAAVVEGAVAE